MNAFHLENTRYGKLFANKNDLYIGQALVEYGEYCEFELMFIKQLVQSGNVVVEIGANIGAMTVPLAQTVGPEGRVFAFEPQPVVFQNLCANLAMNGLQNVVAYNKACGDQLGYTFFPDIDYRQEANFGSISIDQFKDVRFGQRIDICKLDEIEFQKINLLKIDAEGMETEIISGASDHVKQYRPVLFVENDRPEKSEQLINAIFDLDYRLWWSVTPLFNPDNWKGNSNNIWPKVASINMLGVHKSRDVKAQGLHEIISPAEHPMKGRT